MLIATRDGPWDDATDENLKATFTADMQSGRSAANWVDPYTCLTATREMVVRYSLEIVRGGAGGWDPQMLQAVGRLTVADIRDVLLDYLRGRGDWRTGLTWRNPARKWGCAARSLPLAFLTVAAALLLMPRSNRPAQAEAVCMPRPTDHELSELEFHSSRVDSQAGTLHGGTVRLSAGESAARAGR